MVTKSKIGKCQPNVTVLQKKGENITASNSKINNYIHTHRGRGGKGRERKGRERKGEGERQSIIVHLTPFTI